MAGKTCPLMPYLLCPAHTSSLASSVPGADWELISRTFQHGRLAGRQVGQQGRCHLLQAQSSAAWLHRPSHRLPRPHLGHQRAIAEAIAGHGLRLCQIPRGSSEISLWHPLLCTPAPQAADCPDEQAKPRPRCPPCSACFRAWELSPRAKHVAAGMSSGDLPAFRCQECKTPLHLASRDPVEEVPPALIPHGRPAPLLAASLLSGGNGDESFVVLDSSTGARRAQPDQSAGESWPARLAACLWTVPRPLQRTRELHPCSKALR